MFKTWHLLAYRQAVPRLLFLRPKNNLFDLVTTSVIIIERLRYSPFEYRLCLFLDPVADWFSSRVGSLYYGYIPFSRYSYYITLKTITT